MIWDNEFETLPREALVALQSKRLRDLIGRVYAGVPFIGGNSMAHGASRATSGGWKT